MRFHQIIGTALCLGCWALGSISHGASPTIKPTKAPNVKPSHTQPPPKTYQFTQHQIRIKKLKDKVGFVRQFTSSSNQLESVQLTVIGLNPNRTNARFYLQDRSNPRPIAEITHKANALLGINAAFFTPDFRALGMVKINDKLLKPMAHSSLLSALVLINNQGQIVLTDRNGPYATSPNVIQTGPILINNGAVDVKPHYKISTRTVLAQSKDGPSGK